MPSLIDALMSITLLAPFALPRSLVDRLGITDRFPTQVHLAIAAVYWAIVAVLHWRVLATKSNLLFAILGTLILASSYHWLNVGVGMMSV